MSLQLKPLSEHKEELEGSLSNPELLRNNLREPLPTSLQSDFLPDEILYALTQRPQAVEKLAPPARLKVPAKSSNVWHYPRRREKLKHLTDNISCNCGAGKDVSFLYDAPPPKETPPESGKFDPSFERVRSKQQKKAAEKMEVKLPDTLIPEEFHVVKSRGVLGLEYHDEKFGTQLEDHEKHLTLFPSMQPNSRYEVLQLKSTMEKMLEKAGISDEVEVSGPTQMHRLLELVKKEQDIYNIVFHEIIRQTTVDCVERGELLSCLRNKYNALLSKIPDEIKSMHNEVMAQRALDRRLTEELLRFKSTIGILTGELAEVREHDKRVSADALNAQKELKEALEESKRNTDLLNEYHELYELQRQRLEQQVCTLMEEKELWSSASYCLALKVSDECKLTTAKRLHVAEKSWHHLISHFTLLLSDRDTESLTELQKLVDSWNDHTENLAIRLKMQEDETRDALLALKKKIQKFKEEFKMNFMNAAALFIHVPDRRETREIYETIVQMEDVLSKELERFGGNEAIALHEKIKTIKGITGKWTEESYKIYNRHLQSNDEPHAELQTLLETNLTLDILMDQFHIRLTGDNGVAKALIASQGLIDVWHTKLVETQTAAMKNLVEAEWARLYGVLDEWIKSVDDIIECIGKSEREDGKQNHPEHLEVTEAMRIVHKWITTTTSGIDSEDARLSENVTQLHTKMVHWMIQILLRLAPDNPSNSEEAHFAALLSSTTPVELHQNAQALFLSISEFSAYVTQCCDDIVADILRRKTELHEDDAELQTNELKRLKAESEEWIHTAKILLKELDTGEVAIDSYDPLKEKPSPEKTAVTETDEDNIQEYSQDLKEDEEEEKEEESEEPKIEDAKPPAEQIPPTEEVKKPIAELPKEVVHVEGIGYDLNTHRRSLYQEPDKPQQDAVKLQPDINVSVPDTETAFEALQAIKQLQQQLQEAEERAQNSEKTANEVELKLAEALDRIEVLTKRAESSQKENEELKATIESMEVKPAMLDANTGVVGQRR